eukprot:TRINITY_DN1195_c0_g3_i1.p1 TRINITY_DN1195_c0_g3~~TRINITY_DN1195_c0_g3_i1.p1  ORF type:complete len:739 (+),score=121.31 TRINITY_DN1195_c0_g3_i1:216-2219(+)
MDEEVYDKLVDLVMEYAFNLCEEDDVEHNLKLADLKIFRQELFRISIRDMVLEEDHEYVNELYQQLPYYVPRFMEVYAKQITASDILENMYSYLSNYTLDDVLVVDKETYEKINSITLKLYDFSDMLPSITYFPLAYHDKIENRYLLVPPSMWENTDGDGIFTPFLYSCSSISKNIIDALGIPKVPSIVKLNSILRKIYYMEPKIRDDISKIYGNVKCSPHISVIESITKLYSYYNDIYDQKLEYMLDEMDILREFDTVYYNDTQLVVSDIMLEGVYFTNRYLRGIPRLSKVISMTNEFFNEETHPLTHKVNSPEFIKIVKTIQHHNYRRGDRSCDIEEHWKMLEIIRADFEIEYSINGKVFEYLGESSYIISGNVIYIPRSSSNFHLIEALSSVLDIEGKFVAELLEKDCRNCELLLKRFHVESFNTLWIRYYVGVPYCAHEHSEMLDMIAFTKDIRANDFALCLLFDGTYIYGKVIETTEDRDTFVVRISKSKKISMSYGCLYVLESEEDRVPFNNVQELIDMAHGESYMVRNQILHRIDSLFDRDVDLLKDLSVLPGEILAMIFERIDNRSIVHFHSSCKYFYELLQDYIEDKKLQHLELKEKNAPQYTLNHHHYGNNHQHNNYQPHYVNHHHNNYQPHYVNHHHNNYNENENGCTGTCPVHCN